MYWFTLQVLIGKTGKEGLKRRVGACDVSNIPMKVARRAKQLLDCHDIDSVREASQGCATFYAWVSSLSVVTTSVYHDVCYRACVWWRRE